MFGERELSGDLGDNLVDIDIKEDKKKNKEIENIVVYLNLYKNEPEMLTKKYTELLMDDNVVEIFTKLSHNTIFMEQFPEFYEKNINGENVINCQQNSNYHRYGVFKHILYTIEIVGKESIQRNSFEMKILKWTMLLHDIGKPYVKVITPSGNDSFAGHDDKSVELATKILDRFFFSEEEKNIILTLIKYHDRYLNEGELTFDNMSFLARELGNRKDLFYLLIDVKIADSKGKTIEVYNKFMVIVQKYYNFANQYFNNINMTVEQFDNGDGVDIVGEMAAKDGTKVTLDMEEENQEEQPEVQEISEPLIKEMEVIEKFEELKETDFKEIYNQLLERKLIYPVYQPIVNIEDGSIYGFESFNRINYSKNIKIIDFIQKAKDFSKYDKVQQLLFVSSIDRFQEIKMEDVNRLFVSIDTQSYKKYVNKPRLYELMEKTEVVVELSNYDNMALAELQDCIKQIRSHRGKVLLNYFGTNKFTLNDLDSLVVDYVKYDLILLNNFEESEENKKYLLELSTYCLSRDIELVVMGVENLEQLNIIKNMGIKYIQGYVFGKPASELDKSIKRINEVKTILESDDSIV